MGRFFAHFDEAVEEIRRDVAKGTRVDFTRVQQRVGAYLPGRERTAYEYTVLRGIPMDAEELIDFGRRHEFPLFQTEADRAAIGKWLLHETGQRLYPLSWQRLITLADPEFKNLIGLPAESLHPALKTSLEGNWPAYLYRDRLVGAVETITQVLRTSPDSRRAFWPIFQPQDSLRASAPTRIPCSIGYQCMLRKQNDQILLQMVYLQRSSDFDTFWLTDVYLAYQFQLKVAQELDVDPGSFSHFIISFHSFKVEGTEIY